MYFTTFRNQTRQILLILDFHSSCGERFPSFWQDEDSVKKGNSPLLVLSF